MFSVNGKIVFLNSAGVKLFGKRRIKDIVGYSIWDFISSDQKEKIDEKFNRVSKQNNKDQSLSISGEFTRNDGKLICAEIKVNPIEYKGEPSIQILIQDISEKQKL